MDGSLLCKFMKKIGWKGGEKAVEGGTKLEAKAASKAMKEKVADHDALASRLDERLKTKKPSKWRDMGIE